MTRLNKDFRKLIEREGAIVLAADRIGSGHIKVSLRAPDGRETAFTVPCTPSDRRAAMNCRAYVRRFIEGRERQHHSNGSEGQ